MRAHTRTQYTRRKHIHKHTIRTHGRRYKLRGAGAARRSVRALGEHLSVSIEYEPHDPLKDAPVFAETLRLSGNAVPLEQASPALRLAATASAFSEWLVSSPYAGEVTPDRLLGYLGGVPEVYGADARPRKLEWMIRQAKSIAGK